MQVNVSVIIESQAQKARGVAAGAAGYKRQTLIVLHNSICCNPLEPVKMKKPVVSKRALVGGLLIAPFALIASFFVLQVWILPMAGIHV